MFFEKRKKSSESQIKLIKGFHRFSNKIICEICVIRKIGNSDKNIKNFVLVRTPAEHKTNENYNSSVLANNLFAVPMVCLDLESKTLCPSAKDREREPEIFYQSEADFGLYTFYVFSLVCLDKIFRNCHRIAAGEKEDLWDRKNKIT